MRATISAQVILLTGCLLSIGCSVSATYPKAQIAQSVQDFLMEEGITSSVRLIEHTLGVQFEYPEALAYIAPGEVGLGSNFDEAARKALAIIHRVLLSTDAKIDFYLLLISDPQVPGAYLTMIRAFEDIRKVHVSKINITEMLSRTVYELNMTNNGDSPLTLDNYLSREITLSDFLTWQLQRRLRDTLTEALQGEGTLTIGRCMGEFKNGEFGFVLNVASVTQDPMEEQQVAKVFDTATALISKVIQGYAFEDFDSITLFHPATGRRLVMPRAKIGSFL